MNKKLALSPLVIEAKSQVRKVLESQITFKSPYKRQINLELLSHACKWQNHTVNKDLPKIEDFVWIGTKVLFLDVEW